MSEVRWPVPFRRLARLSERTPVRVGVTLLVVTAGVVATLLTGLVKIGPASRGLSIGTPAPLTVPSRWQPYRDPVGFFTAQIPVGWRATDGPNTPWTPSLAQAVRWGYMTYLTDPLGGINDWGLVVQVDPFRYERYAHDTACEWRSGWQAQVAGLPAHSTPDGASFATDAALYYVHYRFEWQAYAGLNGVSIGPVPAQNTLVAQQVLQRFVSTLRPLPFTPLSC